MVLRASAIEVQCSRLLRILSLVGALLSPACLAGVPIAEEDGGGQSATPFEIGDNAMVVPGTSFASTVDSSHARVPTPDGAIEGSLFGPPIGGPFLSL